MKTRTPDQVLDEIARAEIGPGFNLSSALGAKIRKEDQIIMKRKSYLYGAVAFVLVVVVLMSIPSVSQAVKRMFGYIPGAGIVEQNAPLRILPEPVVVEAGQVKVTVNQAVGDATHTRLSYQVENIPLVMDETSMGTDKCKSLPWMELSDGSKQDAGTITGNFWGGGYSRTVEFSALPLEENTVNLVFPCFEGARKEQSAQVAKINLTFVNAPADMKVYPIVDLPTPTSQATSSAALSLADQLSLVISNYIQTDQQVILIAALKTESEDFRLSLAETSDVHLTDVEGADIPFTEDYTLSDSEIGKRSATFMPLVYRAEGVYPPGKATLSLDRAWITHTADVTFDFDPGADPQPGQVWVLNQTVDLDGHPVTIKDISRADRDAGLIINYSTSAEIASLSMLDLDHKLLGGGGGSDSSAFGYTDGFPTGVIHITITSYDELVTGPWQATVELPALAGTEALPPSTEACLTQETWNAALINSAYQFPEGLLDDRLILSSTLAPENYYHVLSADLSGGNPVDLGLGDGGSLSPDGQKLVYATEDGLNFRNTATGEGTLIPGTSRRDRDPIWSPDGMKIAFSRGPASGLIGAPGPYEVMLMNADGSGQQPLVSDNQSNNAQSWMPDSQNLLFTVRGPLGVTVKSINVETGGITELREINYQNAGVTVSPDGTRIAYEAMLPGERYGVYTSNLDGSDELLIANAYPIVVTRPAWSPDGQWLAMSVQDTTLDEFRATLALVNPATCQIIPLTSLNGYVTAWR